MPSADAAIYMRNRQKYYW